MMIQRYLQFVFWALLSKIVFVSSRSAGQITSEGALTDRVKRGSPSYEVSNTKQLSFTDIATKIKDVIDSIQPNGDVVSEFENGFRAIDYYYKLFHQLTNNVGDSPVRRPVLFMAFFKMLTLMKEVESDMCPLKFISSRVAQIGEIVSDIKEFIEDFQSARRRIMALPESERLAEAESLGRNGTLSDLKDFKTPAGSSFSARIRELTSLDLSLEGPEDKVAVLCAMADGTITYVSKMLFSIELQSYLTDRFYNSGNMERYNEYFNLLLSNFRDVKNSLVGGGSNEQIIQSVITSYANLRNRDWNAVIGPNSDRIARKITDTLTQIKIEMERIELPLIVDVPEKLMGKPDFEGQPIKTPLGSWQDGANVTYAVQYRHNHMYSRLGEWMDPITVSGEANPTLKIRVHPKRFDRLIFRKFDDQKPQLVGVLEDKYQTEFRDVNRDLYNAATRFDKKSLEEAEILINNGADIDAVFERGRRAIHAAALSDNFQIAKKFLIKTGNQTDNAIDVKDNEGNSPMHVASEAGHRRFIQLLLDSGADVNAEKYDARLTPIHIAAERGFVSTVKTLLKSSVIDVNSQDFGGFTPLHRAVGGGIPVLEVLMADKRIDLQATSIIGLTPLMVAVMDGYEDITEAILSNEKVKVNSKSNINMTALSFASLLGNTEIVEQLLHKSDIDVNQKSVDGWTPLHLAIAVKNADGIRALLSKLVNQTNVLTASKISPLHIAVVTDQKEVVQDLIKHGATIDDRTESGLTPVHLALLHKNIEIFNILIDSGADIQAKTSDGSSLLHFAIVNNKFDIIESLVKKGVDINAKNILTGETLLHTAVQNGNLEVVQILVQHGANVSVKNRQGESPLHYAASSSVERTDILDFLASNGADIDLTDNLDRTALHLAVKNDYLLEVDSLVENGATVNCKDYLGVTPLHIASEEGMLSLVDYLLVNGASVNVVDNKGRTPLHHAVRNGHEEGVEIIKRYSVDPFNIHDDNFQSPVHLAVVHNNTEIVNFIRQHVGSNTAWKSPLILAVALGRVSLINHMFNMNYNLNKQDREYILETAAAAGMVEMVDHLLSTLQFNEYSTSLCTAAQYGHTEVFDRIRSRYSSSYFMNSDNIRVPIPCCTQGDLNMMEYLISKGYDVKEKCPDGLTPLRRAANAGYTDIVKMLLKHLNEEPDIGNQKLLQTMAGSGRMDEVKTLLDQGTQLNSTALGGITLLHIMAQSGNLDELKNNVDKGSSVNVTTLKGETPLHFAARGGKVDTINYLVSQNADINAEDTKGRTPLYWALESTTDLDEFKASMITLIDHGASVNHKCKQGKTPLHEAASRNGQGSLAAIQYLITKKAEVNAKDIEGNTPLFDAVRTGNTDTVKQLVEAGADVTILNHYGESPLHYVTAVILRDPFGRTYNFKEHKLGLVNEPAMDILNYLKSKGAKL